MVCIRDTVPDESAASGAVGKVVLRAKKWAVAACGIFLIGVLLTAFFQWLDDFLSRDQTLDVYMGSNWLVGENRICWLSLQLDSNAKPTGRLDSLQCSVGGETLEPHNITVVFKGVVKPKDAFGNTRPVADQWRCTRNSDRFTCIPMATPVKQ
jgi:hypothetical protein